MGKLVEHHRKATVTQTTTACNLLASIGSCYGQDTFWSLTCIGRVSNDTWENIQASRAFETRAPDWRQRLSTQNKWSCLIPDRGALEVLYFLSRTRHRAKGFGVQGGELASNGGRCLHCGGRMKAGQRVSSSPGPEGWKDRVTKSSRGEQPLKQWSSPWCSGGLGCLAWSPAPCFL